MYYIVPEDVDNITCVTMECQLNQLRTLKLLKWLKISSSMKTTVTQSSGNSDCSPLPGNQILISKYLARRGGGCVRGVEQWIRKCVVLPVVGALYLDGKFKGLLKVPMLCKFCIPL